MKKVWLGIILCLMVGLLCGCASSPGVIGDAAPETLVSADASALPGQSGTYVLYFRLGNEMYLAAEEREIEVNRDEMPEMALVRQLLAGPSTTGTALTPLFPAGTEVIAVSRQGDILFVTLNEAFLSGYSAEKSGLSGEEKRQAVQAERQLCLDALAATLTDAGCCTRVQVLIHRTQMQGNSLRLAEDYLYQNGSNLPLDMAVRREESLYTPHNAAHHILSLWMARDFSSLKNCISLQGRPAEQQMTDVLADCPVLTGFVLAPGQTSQDGQTAIVTAEITLYQNENTWIRKGYPLRLHRENGVWKIRFDTLTSMMAEE